MTTKTKALVIKEQSVGESDRLITILTEKEGLIRAFARRAKNYKDSKHSATTLFAYSEITLYKGRDAYIVDSAKPIEIFFELRENIVSLSLAQYFCELAFLLVDEYTDRDIYLKIILNSLHFLCKKKKDPLQLKAITELKLLAESGYMPNLIACRECACYEGEQWFFSVANSDIICKSCVKNDEQNLMPLGMGVLTALRHIIYADFNKLYSFNLPKDGILNLTRICENYTLYTLRKMPMTLDFFKTINDEQY